MALFEPSLSLPPLKHRNPLPRDRRYTFELRKSSRGSLFRIIRISYRNFLDELFLSLSRKCISPPLIPGSLSVYARHYLHLITPLFDLLVESLGGMGMMATRLLALFHVIPFVPISLAFFVHTSFPLLSSHCPPLSVSESDPSTPADVVDNPPRALVYPRPGNPGFPSRSFLPWSTGSHHRKKRKDTREVVATVLWGMKRIHSCCVSIQVNPPWAFPLPLIVTFRPLSSSTLHISSPLWCVRMDRLVEASVCRYRYPPSATILSRSKTFCSLITYYTHTSTCFRTYAYAQMHWYCLHKFECLGVSAFRAPIATDLWSLWGSNLPCCRPVDDAALSRYRCRTAACTARYLKGKNLSRSQDTSSG